MRPCAGVSSLAPAHFPTSCWGPFASSCLKLLQDEHPSWVVLSVETLREKMSWWLGTCCLVPSSALQQRTVEKLLNLPCLSFPLGKLRSGHCPSWR